ncbi:zinc finger protein 525-like [Daktulosphaira vitifoliae]|uniref:zinc finger protein 525-like n=1 Tax=Daktulosphaira vitifoliae TaxID=58002 RepID=UPI0021A9856B|nr:zinc finger protein 525-like [Daktulosphaira vitifoliae]
MDKSSDRVVRKETENEVTSECRLCLDSKNVTINISQPTDKFPSVADKINYCTSLVIKIGDKHPQKICTNCAGNLEIVYAFKSKAISSDLELTNRSRSTFTYVQVSDDPKNMTFKLKFDDSDESVDLESSCVYNIVDGDELIVEPVNIMSEKNTTDFNEFIDKNISKNKTIYRFKESPKISKSNNGVILSNKKSDVIKSSMEIKRNFKKISENNDEIFSFKKQKLDSDDIKPVLVVKNGKVIYYCNVCNFEADTMTTLLTHRTFEHKESGQFKCTECPTTYKTLHLLKRHFKSHNDIFHKCKLCDKQFSQKQALERHINTYHNTASPLEFQCVKCNAYFDSMDEMEDHLVIHYTNPSNGFSCNNCDRTFTTFVALNKHIDLEHTVQIECNICHVVLPSKEAMEKHNNSVHRKNKSNNQKYECTNCKKCFNSLKDILNHRKTHLTDQS